MTIETSPQLWQLDITATRQLAPHLSEWLQDQGAVVTEFVPQAGLMTLAAIMHERPVTAQLHAGAAVLAMQHAQPLPQLAVSPVPPTDWLQHVATHYPALPIGRLLIGSQKNQLQNQPLCVKTLWIAATSAFGTGEHATTRGCLEMLQLLLKRKKFSTALDLGCGTGILALAAKKLGVRRVWASDNDPEAIRVARELAAANGLRLNIVCGAGLQARALQRRYDLVMANLFARPLCQLSRPVVQQLAPHGRLIAAGLLNMQARQVIGAYNRQGLALQLRIVRGNWSILVFRKRL